MGRVPPAIAPANPSDAYRRQARRLRCRFAGQPGRLQHSLARLAGEAPPTRAPHGPPADSTLPRHRPASARNGPARQFADYLLDQMTPVPTVLCYSQRLDFLRAARRFGVGRFEANLLIAAVLERRRPRAEDLGEPDGASVTSRLAAFLLVESAVLLGAWWAVFY